MPTVAQALLLTMAGALLAQGPLEPRAPRVRIPAETPSPNIRVDTSLVLIPVHVTTAAGASITDLSRESFQLFEDGAEQKITYFAKDDAPVSLGVLLDTSASMQHKMQRSSRAAARCLQSANREDEFFLIEFNDRPKLTVPFTNDTDALYRRFSRAGPFGRTSLFDAVHLASVQMKNARNTRKVILIISDGGDNHSRLSARQVKTDVLESDMQTYAIGIFDDGAARKRPQEEVNGPNVLEELAEETGGRHYRVDNLNELASVAERISIDMRNEYLLGYSPANVQRDGKYHRVKVNVNPIGEARLRAFYRRGYYAPIQ
jgi:Ca-activated chloride channel family protein